MNINERINQLLIELNRGIEIGKEDDKQEIQNSVYPAVLLENA